MSLKQRLDQARRERELAEAVRRLQSMSTQEAVSLLRADIAR